MSGRWPNMRRGSVWVARKIATQMGEQRPIEQISDYRTPMQGLYQVGVGDASGGRGDRRVGVQLLAGDERGFETITEFQTPLRFETASETLCDCHFEPKARNLCFVCRKTRDLVPVGDKVGGYSKTVCFGSKEE